MKTVYVVVVVFTDCTNLTPVQNMGHIYFLCTISLLEILIHQYLQILVLFYDKEYLLLAIPMKDVCVCILICFHLLHLVQFRPSLIRVTTTCSYRHQSQMQAYLKMYTMYSTNCSLLVFVLLTLRSRATTKVVFSVNRFDPRSRLSSFSHAPFCECICRQV
jgi:hypothetical protein